MSSIGHEEEKYLKRHRKRLLATVALVESIAGAELLDVGGQRGAFLSYLGRRRTLVDTEENVRIAESRGIVGVSTDLDSEGLPFPENSFDTVTMLEVIEHLSKKEAIIRDCNRVLRHGGHLIVSTPNARNVFWAARDRLLEVRGLGNLVFRLRTGRWMKPEDRHKGRLTRTELTRMLVAGGLSIVSTGSLTIFWPNDALVVVTQKR